MNRLIKTRQSNRSSGNKVIFTRTEKATGKKEEITVSEEMFYLQYMWICDSMLNLEQSLLTNSEGKTIGGDEVHTSIKIYKALQYQRSIEKGNTESIFERLMGISDYAKQSQTYKGYKPKKKDSLLIGWTINPLLLSHMDIKVDAFYQMLKGDITADEYFDIPFPGKIYQHFNRSILLPYQKQAMDNEFKREEDLKAQGKELCICPSCIEKERNEKRINKAKEEMNRVKKDKQKSAMGRSFIDELD